jgi:hypothetical protein
MNIQRIERKNLFGEGALLLPFSAIMGILLIPLICCYIASLPLTLYWGRIDLLFDRTAWFIVSGADLVACVLYILRPQNRFLRWLPAIGMLAFEFVMLVVSGHMSDWIVALPIFSWTIGGPVLTAILFAVYCRTVGLVGKVKEA